jgi:hypothetical protein
MKYLRLFENESDYQSFKEGSEYITPNVSYLSDLNTAILNPYIPPISLCDIAYWNGSTVKTISKDDWNTSLGTPIGVVVIPEGMLPDGKARIISLTPFDINGNPTSLHSGMMWGNENDTSLTNYNRVPTTDNSGSSTTGSFNYGYLPSDNFTGTQSFVDPKVNYSKTSYLIPSPYLGDDKTLNPAYNAEISGYNNALSDFNGLHNTEVLVGLGSDYVAANAAWNYKDGVSNLQWYLPAMGELGFLMPRFNEINETITFLGGIAIDNTSTKSFYWSSSEYGSNGVYHLAPIGGYMNFALKTQNYYARAFGIL